MATNDKYSSYMGIALAPDSDGAFTIGKFATSNKDVHFALDSTTRPKALDVCADDGGTALTAGSENCMPIRGRMLLRTAIASGAVTVFGLQGQLKVGAVSITSTGDGSAGVWAYFECVSGSTLVGDFAAIRAVADVPSGATQTSGIVSALQIDSMGLDGTTSGDLACIHIRTPDAGTWDYFLQLDGASTGVSDAVARTGTTSARNLKVKVGDSVLYIPLIVAT